MAGRTNGVRRIPTGHSPFLSRPAEPAALLDEIVGSRPRPDRPGGSRGRVGGRSLRSVPRQGHRRLG
jgi:hypothetical protein